MIYVGRLKQLNFLTIKSEIYVYDENFIVNLCSEMQLRAVRGKSTSG